MKLYAGTSGYSYKEWKGSFYPEKIPASEMLQFYASRLPAVELNNTYYRSPKPSMVESWRDRVPESFRFSVKVPQWITRFKRLKDAAADTKLMLKNVSVLGDRLGAVLFRLPDDMEKDLERLESFLRDLPAKTPAVFDFRHPTWFDDEVFELLRRHNRVLCVSDTADSATSRIDKTADWGYLRLRRVNYSKADLTAWIERVRAQEWKTVYVFFKHEDEGTGPKLAAQFIDLCSAAKLCG
jgi:uncharacterized protein YecE (DUF72 family)